MIYAAPAEPSALIRAFQWIEAVMLGPIATTIAILAVASLGLAMLSGRLSVRRGLTALLGCFITFGAASIAHGIAGLAQGQSKIQETQLALTPQSNFNSPQTAKSNDVADPYAGASVRN